MDGRLLPCWFIAVEKQEPFRCGVWQCSEDSLAAATEDNELALREFYYCRDANDWPTGYESVRTL